MALTLLDLASLEQKPLKKAILMSMFKSALPSPVEQLGIENAQSLSQQVVRITDFGAPTTRALGQAVAAYQATFSDRTETLQILENKITLDKIYLEIKTFVQDPLAMQMKAYAEIVRTKINDMLVNGDPGADATSPAGINYRLNNDAMLSGQSINIPGAALDVSASDANRNTWIDNMDLAVTLCAGGKPDIVIVNRQTWVRLRSALRILKVLMTTKDQYDREIMTYGTTKIINAGQKPANVLDPTSAGQIIGADTLTSVFGTASTTPMHFLQTQGDDAVKLLQLHPLRMQRIGIDPADPGQYVIDMTWPVGFSFPYRFCISSLQGLTINFA